MTTSHSGSILPGISRDPIAVIGIGCRFPGGASSPRRLWDFLTQGRCAIVEVPRDRWDHRRYYDPDPNTDAAKAPRWWC